MELVLERLKLLEAKVQETLAGVMQARAVRDTLEEKMLALQGEMRAREQEATALRMERERETAELGRLRAEREEVRTRVEGLLEEIGRLETALQTAGGSGSAG